MKTAALRRFGASTQSTFDHVADYWGYGMKLPGLVRSKSKRLNEELVRERKCVHEKKLEVAELRANLVHEEYTRNVKEVYDFSQGKDAREVGGFGEVQVVHHRQSGAKFAMKTVPLSRVKSRQGFDFVMREVDLLKSLDHPNIVRLQEVYVTNSHLYMAMDLIEGGSLAGRCRFKGEKEAAVVVRQIVRALRYLHDRNIAHRDLKLENILLETSGERGGTPCVKLVDFGLSAIYEENGVSTDVLGSWNYVAPEVIKGRYRPALADMWSLGVVAYVLISGVLPFDGDTKELIKHKVSEARFAFPGKSWAGTSETCKHFIRSLLLKSPELRLAAADAQRHAWLKGAEEKSQTPRKDSSFREEVTRSIVDFRQANGMKQLALEVVARTLDQGQIRLLTEEFDRADNDNNGEVSMSEFKRWLEANGAARGMTDEEVETLFKAVDVDNSGFIHFNEFLAATIQQRQLDETQLWPAFDRLDRSHTGFINLDDVTLITGAAATKEEAAVLVGYFDINGDGQISFGEFVNGMRRMRGTERDGKGFLPLPLSPGPTASSPHHLSRNASEIPDNIRGGKENAPATPRLLSEQDITVATVEVGVSEPPDRDEVSCREDGIIDSQESDGNTQVWKEARHGVAIKSIESCGGNGLEISGESPRKGGAAGVAAVVPGAPAVETTSGVETGQRPEIGHGTSRGGTSGDAERQRPLGRVCGGCVVG